MFDYKCKTQAYIKSNLLTLIEHMDDCQGRKEGNFFTENATCNNISIAFNHEGNRNVPVLFM